MTNELRMAWKEEVVAQFEVVNYVCLENLSSAKLQLQQGSSGQGMNSGRIEYEGRCPLNCNVR
jgi:hypothetical protein